MTSKDESRESEDSSNTTPSENQRDFLEVTGSNGRWQLGVCLVLFFISIPGAGLNLAITFTAPDIDYWCARPAEAANLSLEEWKILGLPAEDKLCSRYLNFTALTKNHSMSATSIIRCDSWEFDHTFYTSTMVEKYTLVCEREWLVSLSKSIFRAGLMVSVVMFGHLADRIGRRWTITISCWITLISSGICAFSSSFTLFLAARFFVAVGVGGYYNNLYVLLVEITSQRMREVYGNVVHLGTSVGFICLPGLAWLIRDAFWIQIALAAPYLIFLGVWWMISESPRWLLSKGRTAEAKEVLIRASKINNKNIPDIDKKIEEILAVASKEYPVDETEGNILDLIKTPGMWQVTLNIVFTWFVLSFIYYGISFNTNDLAGDPFVNFAASGAAELPAYVFSILLMRFFGRKKPIVACMIAAGLICISSYFLPEDPAWPRSTLPVIGKFFITSCYGIIYVFTLELFPTVLRSSSLGFASFFEESASIIAPFVRELGNATEPYVPFILFGIMATASGLLTLMLPETTNQRVPSTIKDAVSVARGNKDRQNSKC